LQTQLVVEGRKTAWCAQYDEVTLLPAAARKYEVVSLSGGESVDIVRFLMSLQPDKPIVESIDAAIAWFRESQLNGIKWVEKSDTSSPLGIDRVVIRDPTAPPLWARFYEIGSNRPIFVGRDGVVKYDVAQIDQERRVNYAWYVDGPAKLLNKDYPEWRKRITP
jgi:PelA/Pel-15E family pectate lyase